MLLKNRNIFSIKKDSLRTGRKVLCCGVEPALASHGYKSFFLVKGTWIVQQRDIVGRLFSCTYRDTNLGDLVSSFEQLQLNPCAFM